MLPPLVSVILVSLLLAAGCATRTTSGTIARPDEPSGKAGATRARTAVTSAPGTAARFARPLQAEEDRGPQREQDGGPAVTGQRGPDLSHEVLLPAVELGAEALAVPHAPAHADTIPSLAVPTSLVSVAASPADLDEHVKDHVPVLAAVRPIPSAPAAGDRDGRQDSRLRDVFFGYDSWQITEEGRQVLAAAAAWLRTHPADHATIQGHCDDRGTQAYNFVLGEKRARAVYAYLVGLGIEAWRLNLVSYGKERPFCLERDEGCRRLNRRGHLVLHAPS